MASEYFNAESTEMGIQLLGNGEFSQASDGKLDLHILSDNDSVALFNSTFQSAPSLQSSLLDASNTTNAGPNFSSTANSSTVFLPDRLSSSDTAPLFTFAMVDSHNTTSPTTDVRSIGASVIAESLQDIVQPAPEQQTVSKSLSWEEMGLLFPSEMEIKAPYSDLEQISPLNDTNPASADYRVPTSLHENDSVDDNSEDADVTIYGPYEDNSFSAVGTKNSIDMLNNYLDLIRENYPGIVDQIKEIIGDNHN